MRGRYPLDAQATSSTPVDRSPADRRRQRNLSWLRGRDANTPRRLAAPPAIAGAGDPRSPAGALRTSGQHPARPTDRRARADDPLPEHQRPQSRRRLRAAAPSGCRAGLRSVTRRSPWSPTRSSPAASRRPRRRGSRRSLRRLPTDGGEPTLDWLDEAERDEAIDFLVELPGVGRKTAACVMIFALGRPEIPVDTHVYRVGGRLGLFGARASFEAPTTRCSRSPIPTTPTSCT